MSPQTVACTACGNSIEQGEIYTAEVRNTERAGHFGSVKVQDSEVVAQYHQSCAPWVLCCSVCDKPYGDCLGHPGQ